MNEEIKIISLALSVATPLIWAITILLDGFRHQRSRVYLFFALLIASMIYSMTYAKFMGHIEWYASLFPLQAGIVLTLFPLFYLYIYHLTSDYDRHRPAHLWHYLPALAMHILFLVIQKGMMTQDEETVFIKVLLGLGQSDHSLFQFGKFIYDVGRVLFVISGLLYMFFTIRLIRRHFQRIRELFPTGGRSELTWLRAGGLAMLLMMVFYVIIHVLRNSTVIHSDYLISASYLSFAAFFWFLGFNGYQQREVFNLRQVDETDHFESDVRISREQIEFFLNQKRPYTNPDVSVFDFCYEFHTNRTYMSEAISKGFGTNFRGLINQYRIRDAVTIINKAYEVKKDIEFEHIASEVGFSSYSTFLRVFKSELGITPSEHLKRLI